MTVESGIYYMNFQFAKSLIRINLFVNFHNSLYKYSELLYHFQPSINRI